MKTWLIGASSGIGEALAIDLAEKGHKIILSARNETHLNAIASQIGKEKCYVGRCDVLDLKSLQDVYNTFHTPDAPITQVIFAAGIYDPMPLKNFDIVMANRIIDTNLKGALNVFEVIKNQACDPSMYLHLAWISSVAGYRGLPNSGAYGVSKAALINFAELQAAELSHLNTKVQVINPGFVRTQLTDKNTFKMPMIISPKKAAHYIHKGLNSSSFDIHFPKYFTLWVKLLRLIPDSWYFSLSKFLRSE